MMMRKTKSWLLLWLTLALAGGALAMTGGALSAADAPGRPAAAAPASRESVRPGHPRIFLRAEELPAWRARFDRAPLRETYQKTREALLGLSAPSSNGYVSSAELQGLALISLVEDRSGEAPAKAKQWMEYFAAEERGDHWSHPLITKALSLAYDWLYPDLTPAERSRYGRTIVRYADLTLSYADHNAPPPGATWCNQVSDYYNQFYWHHARVVFAGLALAGEPEFREVSDRYLGMSEEWLKHHMLPATNQAGKGGGWFESLGYNDMTAPPFADMVEAWRTGTGEDLFPASALLAGNSAWVLHSIIPHSGQYLPLDDIHPGARPTAGGAPSPLLARRYRDGYAQRLTEMVFPGQYPVTNFPYLLWYDPSLPPVDLTRAEKGRRFEALGQVNMRTGWGKDDTLAIYRAGRVYGGHGQASPGHFLIYRKGDLLVEDGYYGAMSSAVHNTLYIGGEVRPLAHGSEDGAGASPQHYVPQMDGTTYDYATITGYYHDPAFSRYDWVDSDLSRSYRPEKARQVTRRFVFLHPRTFLVLDRIHSPEGIEKRFRLHLPALPTLDAARKLAVWRAEAGQLSCQTLLPAEAKLQVSPGEQTQVLSVARPTPVSDETFVHVLVAGDPGEQPPMAQLVEATDGFRAVVVEQDKLVWVVVFRTGGAPARAVSYRVPGLAGRKVIHLVADLAPGRWQITGAQGRPQVLQHTAGPLSFESTGGGQFSLRALAR